MRFTRPKPYLMAVVLLICGTIAALSYRSKLHCWIADGNYELKKSIYVKVEPPKAEDFFQSIEAFAKANDMWFSIDRYSAGRGGYDHDTFVVELFDCAADINIENNHGGELFGIHFARNSSGNAPEFERIRNRFEVEITGKFERQQAPAE